MDLSKTNDITAAEEATGRYVEGYRKLVSMILYLYIYIYILIYIYIYDGFGINPRSGQRCNCPTVFLDSSNKTNDITAAAGATGRYAEGYRKLVSMVFLRM